MTVHRSVLVATIVLACGCGGSLNSGRQAPPPGSASGSSSIVGTGAVIRALRGGQEVPSPFPDGRIMHYTLTADGTFRITAGDATLETGTWSVDTAATPMGFDHIPIVDGRPGPLVPGIYAIVRDTLTVCFLPATPGRQRPTELQSSPDDGAWLMVFTRVSR